MADQSETTTDRQRAGLPQRLRGEWASITTDEAAAVWALRKEAADEIERLREAQPMIPDDVDTTVRACYITRTNHEAENVMVKIDTSPEAVERMALALGDDYLPNVAKTIRALAAERDAERAKVVRLREVLEMCDEALRFYAKIENWKPIHGMDCEAKIDRGARARVALADTAP